MIDLSQIERANEVASMLHRKALQAIARDEEIVCVSPEAIIALVAWFDYLKGETPDLVRRGEP